MSHPADPSDYSHITVHQLAPTFGAEVTGVDFSKPVAADVFEEIIRAITKVRIESLRFPFKSLQTPLHFALRMANILSGYRLILRIMREHIENHLY